MGKIYTPKSLTDVLRYTGSIRRYPVISVVGPDGRDNTTHCEIVLRRSPDIHYASQIFPVAISDINKGRFDGYANGHIQLQMSSELYWRIDQIKSMDQEKLLDDNLEILKYPAFVSILSISESRDPSGSLPLASFSFDNDPTHREPALLIDRTAQESKDPQRVRNIVLPFLDESRLDDVVREILRN